MIFYQNMAPTQSACGLFLLLVSSDRIHKMQGIYFIRNTRTGRIYVGQSVDFEQRKAQHLYALKAGQNKNKPLQNDYDKLGVSAFVFEMIEETDDLIERERYWISQQTDPYNVQFYPTPSKMDRMPSILRRIRAKGLNR